MPTGEEIRLLVDGMFCGSWYAQNFRKKKKEFGSGNTAVYIECGTHYTRVSKSES